MIAKKNVSIIQNSKGQMSVFFSTTILVLITFMGFIINVGIFVKAKINLQNAVDASAFAGAAVQARQITNIGYLNWEMRNIYKEWMFKYYVIGNLNIADIAGSPGTNSDFTMESYQAGPNTATDSYNFPSVCIDFADTGGTGLCRRYMIPGLPEFDSSAVFGLTETTNAFINALKSGKAEACSARTSLNYAAAHLWAYNVNVEAEAGQINLKDVAPQIAPDRTGAFPAAFEMAIRIRNLEVQVNTPPQTSGVCLDQGLGVNCAQTITDYISGLGQSPSAERLNKAFYSGSRNLGSEEDSEMRHSYTLSEISPAVSPDTSETSTSNLLIPAGAARKKYYLDLKLMTLNYSTFYTAFMPDSSQTQTSLGTVSTGAACAATKIGLPIPGYPLGYVKNPNILTYYAVRAKAKFIGLFNPFDIGGDGGITLTAFAAAKPFGGRIGPMLFKMNQSGASSTGSSQITARQSTGTSKFVSSAYMTGMDTSQIKDKHGNVGAPGVYLPGAPIPVNVSSNNRFWLNKETDIMGGYNDSASAIVFGIPNLIYDYPSSSVSDYSSYVAPAQIDIVIPGGGTAPKGGLYNGKILTKFKNNLPNIGGAVSPADITNGIHSARAPTVYEAYNYLIPTPEEFNAEEKVDSFGVITQNLNDTVQAGKMYQLSLYAPIFSDAPDSLYKNSADIQGVLDAYLYTQAKAIEKYKSSMNEAAFAIYDTSVDPNTGEKTALAAANAISDVVTPTITLAAAKTAKPTCQSIAGKFVYFYLGGTQAAEDAVQSSHSSCASIATLRSLMMRNWSINKDTLGEYYNDTYVLPSDSKTRKALFSAYRPGPSHDAPSGNGKVLNVLGRPTEDMRRNFYSTKLITLKSVGLGASRQNHYNRKATIHSQGEFVSNDKDTTQNSLINYLDADSISGLDLKNIEH